MYVISYIYSFMPTVTLSFLEAGSPVCAWFSCFVFLLSDHLHTSSLLGISSLTSLQNIRTDLIFEIRQLSRAGF